MIKKKWERRKQREIKKLQRNKRRATESDGAKKRYEKREKENLTEGNK
jgi:hypothetical protein